MRKKPELVSVSMVVWDSKRGIYGLVTTFDDGVWIREPWGNYDDTFEMVVSRSSDIRGIVSPPVQPQGRPL
jgi:hypothetical protein